MSATLALCALLALPPAQTPTAAWLIEYGLTGDQLKARTATLKEAGYRPTNVSGFNLREETRYAVIWEKAKGPEWRLDWGITPAQLNRRAVTLKTDGFRPVSLSGFDLVGDQGFIDLWRKADGPAWDVQYGKDSDAMETLSVAMKKAGFRPVSVSTYVSGTINRFATIWVKGGDVEWEMKWGLSQTTLDSTMTNLSTLGFRPVAVAGLGVFEDVRFAAVWEKGRGPEWVARYNQNDDDLKTLALAMQGKGFKPVWLSGYNTLRGPRYASIWEKAKP